jgi:hypothetical protein
MHCTVKKTLSAIIDSGNDYLVALKQNQPKLYRAVERLMSELPMRDCYDRRECGHGRIERRIVSVWDAPAAGAPAGDASAGDASAGDAETIDPNWRALHSLIRVERWRQVHSPRQHPPSPESYEQTYYISSRSGQSAYELFTMIRGHWHIENRLHWVKDVQQHDDSCGIRGAEAAENLSALKSIAVTIYRMHGYDSIKHATIRFANKIKELWDFIRT